MRHQDEADSGPSLGEEKERKEQEEHEDQYYELYRVMARLLSAWPRLETYSLFEHSVVDSSAVHINRDEFASRLKYFLKWERSRKGSRMPPLSDELVEFLFEEAVDAHQRLAAWDNIVKNTKRPELQSSRLYLWREVKQYIKIRSLLKEVRQERPGWMSHWAECWVGAVEKLIEEMEGQLRAARHTLEQVCQMHTSARVEVESYILWDRQEKIRKKIAHTQFARNLAVIRAAFAYAAKLVPLPSGGIAGYKDLIKQRISRVSISQRKKHETLEFLERTLWELVRPSGMGKSQHCASRALMGLLLTAVKDTNSNP